MADPNMPAPPGPGQMTPAEAEAAILAQCDRAAAALAEARTLPEVRNVQGKAEGLLAWARRLGASRVVIASAWKVAAYSEIRIAEEIEAARARGELRKVGRPAGGEIAAAGGDLPPTLDDLGIASQAASKAAKLREAGRAAVDAEAEAAIAEGRDPSKASAIRRAKPKPAAPPPGDPPRSAPPPPPPSPSPKPAPHHPPPPPLDAKDEADLAALRRWSERHPDGPIDLDWGALALADVASPRCVPLFAGLAAIGTPEERAAIVRGLRRLADAIEALDPKPATRRREAKAKAEGEAEAPKPAEEAAKPAGPPRRDLH